MTIARRALETLQESIRGLPRNAGLPPILASEKLVRQLGALDSAPATPADTVLEQVRRRLKAAAASEGGIKNAAAKDIRDAAWLLWAEKEPLAVMPGLFDSVREQAERRGSTRRNLIEAWIFNFAPSNPAIADAGRAIRALLDKLGDPRLTQWQEASRRYRFFDAPVGPEAVAREIVQGEQPLAELLEGTGLDDPIRGGSGYARAVQRAVLTFAPEGLRSTKASHALSRIDAFVAPQKKLRLDDGEQRALLAAGLLRAWQDRGREPGADIRDAVRACLLEWLGDPRISTKWRTVDEASIALMLKWLARMSLKAFFDLIDVHADIDHFTYRRAFWEAYIDANVVDEAWLALGSRIFHSAKAVQDLDGAYGRLEGAYVQSNHAILLLRIQDLIFCEWSHNGRLRAWKRAARQAPQLGRSTYAREDVMGLGLPFPPNAKGRGGASDGKGLSHINSSDGYWQSSVAELLARNTRTRLTKQDWMPR
jgi:hypothetical protein